MYDYKNLKFCPRCGARIKVGEVDGRVRKYCGQCSYILYRNPYPGTSAVIAKDGKILLAKRKEEPWIGYWSLPGGYVEYDESCEKAVVREVGEETGFKVKITRLLGVYYFTKKVQTKSIGPAYEAKIIGGKASSDAEVKWFDPKNIPKKFAYPDHVKVIKDWMKINS